MPRIFQPTVTEYVDANRKRVSKSTAGARKVQRKAKKYYGEYSGYRSYKGYKKYGYKGYGKTYGTAE